MKEPRRLLDAEGSAFERMLLGAVAEERPSRALRRRMRQGLAGVGVVAGAKVASAGLGPLAMLGLVAAGVVTGLVRSEPARAPQPAAARTPVVVVAPSVRQQPVTPEPPASAVDVRPAAGETPPSAKSSRQRPQTSPASDLRDEIRALDRARAALPADPARALRMLAEYERRYPRGQFRQEAQVLRVEALDRSGKREAARELGKRFLAEHPESPHVERVETTTGSER